MAAAGAEQQTYKRRQYIVDLGYQLGFVSQMFAVIFLVAVASGVTAIGLLWHHLYSPSFAQQTQLVTSLVAVSTTLLIELLLAIPLVYFYGIRSSHRVVGPIKRLQSTLQAIGQGDFTRRITLREGDVLQNLATSINEMAAALQKRFPTGPPHPPTA